MARRTLTVALVFTSLFLVGGKKGRKAAPEMSVTPAPVQGLYLRSGFDTDPSSYVGRFLPPETTDVDESNAMQLTCSRFVTYKEVNAGGVQYDEVFNASTAVAARIGIPGVVGLGGGHSQSQAVRVRYVLTKKMVAEISDTVAFESCCKAAPDQCTDRYIGEFYEGTGEVYYAFDSSSGGKGRGATTSVVGDIEVKNGVSWAKSVAFPNPIYFAFKTTPNLWTGEQEGGCGDWVNAPPKSTQGTYFVGISDPKSTEASAREAALASARTQTVQWAGTAISEGSITVELASGDRAAAVEQLAQEQVLTTAAEGVAKLVKDESWCVTAQDTPEGQLHVAKVLAFLPKEQESAAAQAVADSLGQ